MFENERQTDGRHRLVIVGGGVGGIDLAASLGRNPAFAVTLVDLATAHVWKPMLHSIAAGTRDSAQEEVPYIAQARTHGFTYVAGRVTGVDRAAKSIALDRFALYGRDLLPERRLPYDTLVLAVGSIAADFGVDGVDDHARHIDTLVEAKAFQADLLPRLVEAARTGDRLRIAIVGGGATGVQLAAELIQMADIADDYGLDDAQNALDVTLVDRGDRLLPAFPEHISTAAAERLRALGATVRTDVAVAGVTPEGIDLGGELLTADIVVWAAGVRAAPLAESIDGLRRDDRTGRIVIDDRCRVPGDPSIYAIGDCATLTPAGRDGPLPPTAQVAYQQAVYLAKALPHAVVGRSTAPFRYVELGALVQLGGYDAYGALGRYGLFSHFIRGRIAQLGHAMLYRRHQARLHGVFGMMRLLIADLAVGDILRGHKIS